MPKILLPTIEPANSRGGIARYLAAIKATFSDDVELINVQPSYLTIFQKVFWQPRKTIGMTWINHPLPIGTVAWLWSLVSRHPYTIFLHGLDFDLARRNAWKRWLSKQILNRAKHIVTNTRALAQEVHDFAPTSTQPLIVYPVVSDELLAAASESFTRHGEQPLTLLTVSRLVERKGHIKVLDALLELDDIKYVIVGSGPEQETIERAIEQRNLSHRVQLLDDADDQKLVEAYRQADIFVMPTSKTPTDREGFGIVYLEAQLFGLPVIATNHPGVDEAVNENVTGLLIDDSHPALVAALRKLISDATLRSRLGNGGPDWVRKNFVREVQMKKLTACLI